MDRGWPTESIEATESALSHQIKRLEQELGTPLFERTSRRVTPTDAGLVIATRARHVLAEVDAAREEIDELRGVLRGRLWIGALQPAGDLDVPTLLARFSRASPDIEVSLREGVAADMLSHLAVDELDAAFCLLAGELADEFAVERLTHEEVVAAFAPDRAPSAPQVGVAELNLEVRSLRPPVHLPVALVWRRERHASPAARAFIAFVRRETTGGEG